jgi:hypothetical protein
MCRLAGKLLASRLTVERIVGDSSHSFAGY